jgi:hypothetical protein
MVGSSIYIFFVKRNKKKAKVEQGTRATRFRDNYDYCSPTTAPEMLVGTS